MVGPRIHTYPEVIGVCLVGVGTFDCVSETRETGEGEREDRGDGEHAENSKVSLHTTSTVCTIPPGVTHSLHPPTHTPSNRTSGMACKSREAYYHKLQLEGAFCDDFSA